MQTYYGKSYYITVSGYFITQSEIIGIVHINEEMTYLEFNNSHDSEENICEQFNSMELNDNVNEYKAAHPFFNENVEPEAISVELEDWLEDETIDLKNYRLIHIAQRKTDTEPFDIRRVKDTFFKRLDSLTDEINFITFDDISIFRLPENEWLVKLPQKMKVKTLFTGLYI